MSNPTQSAPGRAGRVVGAVLLIVALSAALSVDVVRTGYGIKGDEATYVSWRSALHTIAISASSVVTSSDSGGSIGNPQRDCF